MAAAFGEANMSYVRECADEQQVGAMRDDLRSADVLVTFIDDDWIGGVQDSDGLRRLLLTEAVLSDVPIAPVLINDARLPEATLLPDELHFLLHGEIPRFAAGSTVFESIDGFIDSVERRFASASTREPAAGRVTAAERGDRIRSEQPDLVAFVDAGWRRTAALAEVRRQERESWDDLDIDSEVGSRPAARGRRFPGSAGAPPAQKSNHRRGARSRPHLPWAGVPSSPAGQSTRAGQAVQLGVSGPEAGPT